MNLLRTGQFMINTKVPDLLLSLTSQSFTTSMVELCFRNHICGWRVCIRSATADLRVDKPHNPTPALVPRVPDTAHMYRVSEKTYQRYVNDAQPHMMEVLDWIL